MVKDKYVVFRTHWASPLGPSKWDYFPVGFAKTERGAIRAFRKAWKYCHPEGRFGGQLCHVRVQMDDEKDVTAQIREASEHGMEMQGYREVKRR